MYVKKDKDKNKKKFKIGRKINVLLIHPLVVNI